MHVKCLMVFNTILNKKKNKTSNFPTNQTKEHLNLSVLYYFNNIKVVIVYVASLYDIRTTTIKMKNVYLCIY